MKTLNYSNNMKFILWTLVWLGISEIQKWRYFKFLGYDRYKVEFSSGIIILSLGVEIFLWIYLYNHFIK